MKRDITVENIITESKVNDLLEELSEQAINDMAVTYRTDDGQIHTRWLGDSIALATMVDLLREDIMSEIEIVDG
jgi:hypothetical protein